MPNWKKVIVSGSSAHLNQVTASNGIQLVDDAVLNFGDGNDLQIHHDGNNSFIKDAGTGGLFYRGGTQTFQNAAGSKTMATFNAANSVDLNYNNSTKFQTTNIGVSVTGNVVASGNISGSNISGSFQGDGSGLTGVGGSVTIKDEGSNLTTSVSSIDFVGSGVTATTSGNNVTATITGADLDSIFETDDNGDLMPTTSTEGLSVFYDYDSNNDIQPRA